MVLSLAGSLTAARRECLNEGICSRVSTLREFDTEVGVVNEVPSSSARAGEYREYADTNNAVTYETNTHTQIYKVKIKY